MKKWDYKLDIILSHDSYMQIYLIIQNNPYQNPIIFIVIPLLKQIDKIILKSIR